MPQFNMTALERAKTNIEVNNLNKKINVNKKPEARNSSLGKDSFLKLLVTQLQHQDPTKPMEDKEFISQMAQFSTLEQITNLNKEIKSLLKSSESSRAYGLLGKRIDSYNPMTKKEISGIVSSIRYNDGRMRMIVGNEEIELKDILAVHNVINNKKTNSK